MISDMRAGGGRAILRPVSRSQASAGLRKWAYRLGLIYRVAIMRAFRYLFLVLLLLAVPSLVTSCNGGGIYGPLGATCPQLSSNMDPLNAHFSADAEADGKVRAFVSAAKDLVTVSVQMQNEAAQACQRMGMDLGIPPAQMQAQNGDEPGASAQAACNAVAARIDAIMRQGVQIRVQGYPPRCQANVQAKASCDAACNVQVNPAQIIAQCQPGRLSGYCSGTCQGQCEGNCNGQCQGQCSAMGPNGQCAGQCNGTCTGGCNGTCHATCHGTWQAPKCAAYVQPPSASGECNASCNAKAEFRASCQPAQINVMTNANTQEAMRLVATLRANLPELLHAEIALGKRLAGSIQVVVNVGQQLPRVIGNAGAQAVACVAAAANASVKASARINVSVQASASVSGRVGAG